MPVERKNGPKHIPEAKCISALRKWGGIVGPAAREIGITRQTLHDRVRRSKRLQDEIAEIEEQLMDHAESHIVKGVKKGDKFYVRLYANTKGRKRGYGIKVETSLDEGQLEAFVDSLGGDPQKLRAALAAFGASASEV